MKEIFKVLIDDKHSFNINENTLDEVDIIKISESTFHLIHQNKSFEIKITSSNFQDRTYNIMVEGKEFKAKINSQLDVLIDKMGLALKSETEINNIKAPMPGLILKLNVSIGDTIQENDPVLILEAMKMENVILSPKTGVIKSMPIEQGQTVDKNDLLVEFE